LLGLDAAPDKRIKTSDGIKDALLSRLYIHYQSLEYVFVIDWFSAIPQPQTTEGFTYGDLVLGKTWRYEDRNSYLTLGLRQKSIPRTIVVGFETVFNAVNDATEEEYSVFLHFNYHGYDLGSYFSDSSKLESAAFHIPISKSDNRSLTSSVSYYGAVPDIGISKHFEFAIDHAFNNDIYTLRSGMIMGVFPDLNKTDIINLYANYVSPDFSGIRILAGAFYYFDVESAERLPGAKLGFEWHQDELNRLRIGVSVQQNAIGDFNSLVVRDEPILTFTLSAGLDPL